MAPKANVIVALDIGTSNITVVLGEVLSDSFNSNTPVATPAPRVNIIGIGSSPSRGLRKGVVINIESTVESITKAIEQAQTMAGYEINSVYASISGSHIKSFNSHGIVGIKSREVNSADVDRVIEAAKAVAIPLDREVLHVLPQEFIIDSQDGIKEPLGISGVRLEAKVHIVTGAVATAQNIIKCANRCGLMVNDIVLSVLASARAVLSHEEQELGVCLIDIGGGTIELAVYHQGAVRHTAVIPVGGNHITNDIAAGLRTPLVAAEEIKCRYGSALARKVGRDETIEVPSTGDRSSRALSKLVLAEIIEPRVQEIFGLIHKELERAGCLEIITSGIVLSGGTANLTGISALAEQVFNLPVRIGKPQGVVGLTELVSAPQYATGVGLVLHGAAALAGNKGHPVGSRITSLVKRVGNWISERF
jgi:cell division protein FtsA